MSVFYATPFSLAFEDLIVARVSAYNLNGWGATSAANTAGATVRTIPTTMNPPVRDPASSDSQIVVAWTALTAAADTGGSTIRSYRLFWDAGSSGADWYPLLGDTVATLVTQFTVTSSLVGGQAYLFRLQAENVYGWGPYSTDTLIYAAGVPAAPPAAVTAISGTDASITWQTPANSAAPLTAYRIYIRQSDGNFAEELTSCNGATSAIRTALACDVPLTTLRAAPFSLAYGALVQVRVQAQNANGWGTLSQVNVAGAHVETPPLVMDAPTMGSSTSTTSLEIEFVALVSGEPTGGAVIDSYNL
jgi:hypothetical protein